MLRSLGLSSVLTSISQEFCGHLSTTLIPPCQAVPHLSRQLHVNLFPAQQAFYTGRVGRLSSLGYAEDDDLILACRTTSHGVLWSAAAVRARDRGCVGEIVGLGRIEEEPAKSAFHTTDHAA